MGLSGVDAPVLAEAWRGGILESVHCGHVAVARAGLGVVSSAGSAGTVIFPRSSCKMLQALPLVESGAAGRAGLGSGQLALACASHSGAPVHTAGVADWLAALDMGEADLRCGPQPPADEADMLALHDAGAQACQLHNNCSGKHAGFLTLNRHLGGGAEYADPSHPVQRAALAAFEDMTGETSPGFGIDGCSAPNFACTLGGLAVAMAGMAAPGAGARGEAARALVQAMIAHPVLVAGAGRACTRLMDAMDSVAVKTGAEGVYVAILPSLGLGVALKIEDGATRAAESAMAAVLVGLGVLDADDPVALSLMAAPTPNRRGIVTGEFRATGVAVDTALRAL